MVTVSCRLIIQCCFNFLRIIVECESQVSTTQDNNMLGLYNYIAIGLVKLSPLS